MGLIFTGYGITDLQGYNLEAKDADTGKPVVVKFSHQDEHDYGIENAQQVAIEKYVNGDVDADGNVCVRTIDFDMTDRRNS